MSRLLLGTSVTAVSAALVVSHDDLTSDWFSDELWRATFVHSHGDWWELYRSWDTPTPPGFVLLHQAFDLLLPTGPLSLRLITLGWFVLALVLFAATLASAYERPVVAGSGVADRASTGSGEVTSHHLIAAGLTAALLPLLPAFGVHRVFLPYLSELAAAGALLLTARRLDDRPWALPSLLCLVVVLPLFVIGPLFLLPGVGIVALRWGWASPQPWRQRRIRLLAVAGAGGAVVTSLVWGLAYAPVRQESIDEFWAHTTLPGSPRGRLWLLEHTVAELREGLIGWAVPNPTGIGNALLWVGFAGFGLVGAVTLGRRWSGFLIIPLTGLLTIAVASEAARWPFSAERVNLAVHVFVYVYVLHGVVLVIVRVAGARTITFAASLVVLVAVLWPRHETALPFNAFLRGMTSDVQVVRRSEAPHNLLVGYHFSTQWYLRNEVLMRPSGERFTMLAETYDDRRIYDGAWLQRNAEAATQAGDLVWCILPFDSGPSVYADECRLSQPAFVELDEQRGERSVLRSFRRT